MKIVTYNLRFGGSGKAHWKTVLEEIDPEIFLVQETFHPDEHLPPVMHGDLARNAVWKPVPGLPWGSAIFVKGANPRPLDLPAEFEGWVVGCEVDSVSGFPGPQDHPLRLFSVHTPTPKKDSPKKDSYQTAVTKILDMISRFKGEGDIVIGGDFNIIVSERHGADSQQIYDVEQRNKSADGRIRFRLGDEFGLMNCWKTANPDLPLAPTYGKTTHLDGIFVSKSWGVRLSSCSVLSGDSWEGFSDHSPVVATFG